MENKLRYSVQDKQKIVCTTNLELLEKAKATILYQAEKIAEKASKTKRRCFIVFKISLYKLPQVKLTQYYR